MNDAPSDPDAGLDLVGTALSALGLGLVVLGILRAGAWGFLEPEARRPVVARPLAGVLAGPGRRGGAPWLPGLGVPPARDGRPALLDPAMLGNRLLRGRPDVLLLPVPPPGGAVLLRPALPLGGPGAVGGRDRRPDPPAVADAAAGRGRHPAVLPRRIAAAGRPLGVRGPVPRHRRRSWPPSRSGSGPEVVTVPLLLAGLGIGALASQLGSVTVAAVPDEESAEVGGLQNTLTNLGASIGTALAGALLVSGLSTSFLTGWPTTPTSPRAWPTAPRSSWPAGCPFVSDADLTEALADADVSRRDRRRGPRGERGVPDRRAPRGAGPPGARGAGLGVPHRCHPRAPTGSSRTAGRRSPGPARRRHRRRRGPDDPGGVAGARDRGGRARRGPGPHRPAAAPARGPAPATRPEARTRVSGAGSTRS